MSSHPLNGTKDLQSTIDELFAQMSDLTGDDPAYAAMAEQMERLYKLKEVDSNVNSKKRVSPDVWLTTGAHLAGILVIVGYEQRNVLTSKAIGFVKKLV